MYAGHVGIALGLRRVRLAPPLWLLVAAAQLPDWGDSLLELYGGRRVVDPGWSPHGWPLVALGALGAGLIGAQIMRTWRGAVLPALACLSHWGADYITGYKPTWPGGPLNVGLGWYSHGTRDFVLESGVTLVGWLLWRGSLGEVGSVGPVPRPRWAVPLEWALLIALVAMQLGVNAVMVRHHV